MYFARVNPDFLSIRMQATPNGRNDKPVKAWDVIVRTYQQDSIRGFYRGLTPSLLKVVPAVSIGYVTYEGVKKWVLADFTV
jgi:solute carrier family 25 phosphate transporter 23/24/25/41